MHSRMLSPRIWILFDLICHVAFDQSVLTRIYGPKTYVSVMFSVSMAIKPARSLPRFLKSTKTKDLLHSVKSRH